MQFNKGLMHERLLGFDRGHAELLASIDGWLASLEEERHEHVTAPDPRGAERRDRPRR